MVLKYDQSKREVNFQEDVREIEHAVYWYSTVYDTQA